MTVILALTCLRRTFDDIVIVFFYPHYGRMFILKIASYVSCWYQSWLAIRSVAIPVNTNGGVIMKVVIR